MYVPATLPLFIKSTYELSGQVPFTVSASVLVWKPSAGLVITAGSVSEGAGTVAVIVYVIAKTSSVNETSSTPTQSSAKTVIGCKAMCLCSGRLARIVLRIAITLAGVFFFLCTALLGRETVFWLFFMGMIAYLYGTLSLTGSH